MHIEKIDELNIREDGPTAQAMLRISQPLRSRLETTDIRRCSSVFDKRYDIVLKDDDAIVGFALCKIDDKKRAIEIENIGAKDNQRRIYRTLIEDISHHAEAFLNGAPEQSLTIKVGFKDSETLNMLRENDFYAIPEASTASYLMLRPNSHVRGLLRDLETITQQPWLPCFDKNKIGVRTTNAPENPGSAFGALLPFFRYRNEIENPEFSLNDGLAIYNLDAIARINPNAREGKIADLQRQFAAYAPKSWQEKMYGDEDGERSSAPTRS